MGNKNHPFFFSHVSLSCLILIFNLFYFMVSSVSIVLPNRVKCFLLVMLILSKQKSL